MAIDMRPIPDIEFLLPLVQCTNQGKANAREAVAAAPARVNRPSGGAFGDIGESRD